MSKRDALRALSKKFPTPEEVKSIFKGMNDTPDREAAIVAAALAESFLEQSIIRHLKCKQPNLIGDLFQARGPLAEFHSKILIAQAFGVIVSSQAEELHRIKAIRNVFAHSVMPVTFETAEVAKEVDGFKMYQDMMSSGAIKARDDEWPRRKIFIFIAKAHCVIIDYQQKEHSGGLFGDYD